MEKVQDRTKQIMGSTNKLPGAIDWYCTITGRLFCLLKAQIKASQTSLLYLSVIKLAKFGDTFPTSGCATDAPNLAPNAFNAFESAGEE